MYADLMRGFVFIYRFNGIKVYGSAKRGLYISRMVFLVLLCATVKQSY